MTYDEAREVLLRHARAEHHPAPSTLREAELVVRFVELHLLKTIGDELGAINSHLENIFHRMPSR